MRELMRRAAAALAALALSACATLPPELPEAADCRANYLGLDEQVDAADVHNGGVHAIDGFPYLRSNRFLASFAAEATDGAAFDAWVERMRRLDLEARESELRNLGWAEPGDELSHLDRCGAQWAQRDLADPARRAQLREHVEVPDDYSILRRVLGFYPFAVPFLNSGIRNFNEDVVKDYGRPLAKLKSPGPLVLWEPATNVGAPLRRDFSRDALGIPILSDEQWQALAVAHAPRWLIETEGEFDLIGAPVLKDDAPALDTARPLTYFLPAYTRFGDKVLVQLVYVVWVPERPKSGSLDPYGGALDGIVWRVTLDADGSPLLYDTIHACGCYHYYFTAQPLQRKPRGGFWQEPVLFPQGGPEGLPPAPFAIRVQARTHYVRRLVPLAELKTDERRTYVSAPYGDLLSLPDGAGGTRSLFCEDGLACGTERLERLFLWPTGIKSAGAMRQWGRHATSFVGRSHFDDPGMMDRLFKAD
ncbi:MAG: hypothetical protein ACREU7_15140 [Burkholderiales bacterium]